MDKKNSEMSAAELYRQERKKRIEKAAKKNKKTTPELAKFKRTMFRVIAAILVIALVLGCTYGILNFFGVPHKVLKPITIDGAGSADIDVSVAEFNFYYLETYNNLLSQIQQYDQQYGAGTGLSVTGFDTSKAPDKQEYTIETLEGFEEGQKAYWSDYLRITAIDSIHETDATYLEAIAEGYTLSEDEKAEIDSTIEQLREYAQQQDFSLNRYLANRYGNGVNEKLVRSIFEKQQLARKYLSAKYDETGEAITTKEAEKEFEANISDYAIVSVHIFEIASNPDIKDETDETAVAEAKAAALEEAKAKAEEAYSTIKDEETFLAAAKENSADPNAFKPVDTVKSNTTYSALQQSYGAKTADWAFEAERKAGDVGMLEGNDKFIIAFMDEPAHKDETLPSDVRHILFSFPTDEEGNLVDTTDEEKAEIRQKAEKVLEEFKKDPSEEAFIDLVKSVPSDDTASVETGGLYESISASSNYVDAFKNWAIDSKRKAGDVEIVESEYGYHIMYYVGKAENAVWFDTVKAALQEKNFESFYTDTLAKHPVKKQNLKILEWALSQDNDFINKYMIAR